MESDRIRVLDVALLVSVFTPIPVVLLQGESIVSALPPLVISGLVVFFARRRPGG